MNRQKLWDRMKRYGMTQSTLQVAPPDVDLKLIIQHNSVNCKTFFAVLFDEDGPKQAKIEVESAQKELNRLLFERESDLIL